MPNTHISAIANLNKGNRVIGKGNELLWHIPDDLQRFKNITMGHPIIMGRKTHESIGRALPGRTNIVITRDVAYKAEGCIIVHSIEEALTAATPLAAGEIFIIGGAEIYKQAMLFVTRLYLTLVDSDAEGDAFFPQYDEFKTVIKEEQYQENDPPYTFVVLEK